MRDSDCRVWHLRPVAGVWQHNDGRSRHDCGIGLMTLPRLIIRLGRPHRRGRDIVTAGPLDRLSATLDRDDPAFSDGDEVPPLGHWLFFLPNARQSEIGPDGHPKRGGFLPPVHELPRRMWAGSRLSLPGQDPRRRPHRPALDNHLGQAQGRCKRPAGLRHGAPRDRPRRRDRRRSSTSTTSSIAGCRRLPSRAERRRWSRRMAAHAGARRRACSSAIRR